MKTQELIAQARKKSIQELDNLEQLALFEFRWSEKRLDAYCLIDYSLDEIKVIAKSEHKPESGLSLIYLLEKKLLKRQLAWLEICDVGTIFQPSQQIVNWLNTAIRRQMNSAHRRTPPVGLQNDVAPPLGTIRRWGGLMRLASLSAMATLILKIEGVEA